MPENLQDTLTPAHLADLPDDLGKLKEEIADQAEPKRAAVVERNDDPRSQERYTFQLHHRDGAGKVWEGTFTTKILSLGDRRNVGVMRARLQLGLPLEALDMSTADLTMKIAHLSYSLTERPKWANELMSLLDPGVIDAIYQEVASHEAFFLGWPAPEGSSGGQQESRTGDS